MSEKITADNQDFSYLMTRDCPTSHFAAPAYTPVLACGEPAGGVRRRILFMTKEAEMANIQSGTEGTVRAELAAMRLNALDWIAMVLLIVGGLNWGLVGLFDIDVVARLLGVMTTASRTVYVLVGLAAIYTIYLCVRKLPAKP